RADETEPPLLQILAHRIRFRGACRNLLSQPPGVHQRSASDKLPNIAVERSALFLHRQKCPGITYRRSDLQPVADDSLIAQQPLGLPPVVACDFLRVESGKRRTIIFTLPQDRVPAQTRLRAFQNQEL